MSLVKPADTDVQHAGAVSTRGLSDFHLYATAVLIWGSTWLAITFQLGRVPPAVSVVWRFALAAAILFAYAKWKRLPLAFNAQQHLWIAVRFTMFGVNYIAVYLSEVYLASGLVAVIFSLGAFTNIVAMRLFYSTPIEPEGLIGSVLGITGVVLVFWPEVSRFSATSAALMSIGYALFAVSVATLGNIAATRNQRAGMAVVPLNGWAMAYGALFVGLFAVIRVTVSSSTPQPPISHRSSISRCSVRDRVRRLRR